MRESDRVVTWEDEQSFFMSALRSADMARQVDRDADREVLQNYLVQPHREAMPGEAMLVDPETHQIVESLLAFQMLTIMGERGYASALPVGREDVTAGRYVSRLVERSNRVQGNYRSMYTWMKDAYLFGEAVMFPHWTYSEGVRTRRVFDVDPATGEETFEDFEVVEPLIDDCRLLVIDRDDFFPDPSADTIQDMQYAIRRFEVPRWFALDLSEARQWRPSKVREALAGGAADPVGVDQEWRRSLDREEMERLSEDFHPVIGYELFGHVPYKTSDGYRNRRMTMLNGVLVESRGNPLGTSRVIPYYEGVLCPIRGKFGGISPASTVRYTQDFANGLLKLLAVASKRQAGVPVLYNANTPPDLEKLLEWEGPIAVQGDVGSVRELQYNPQLASSFALLSQLKAQMQGASGAEEGLQGRGFGTKRQSATETSLLFQQQISRPNGMAALFEYEYLPTMAKGIFELHQRFMTGTQDLIRRIGVDQYDPQRQPFIGDIQGDFDIEFIGSQRMDSKQLKLQFLERAFTIFGSIPGAAPIFPWAEALTSWLHEADLRDLEQKVADPNGVEDFIERTIRQSGTTNAAAGNGNGEGRVLKFGEASGLQPAQALGRAI